MKTHEVRALLRQRYGGDEWAIFFEVADATGARHTRFADAVAMNLWPSRGLAVHGFEIKVSRSDWKRERDNPAKAEPMVRRCDYWWIVAPADVVPVADLPDSWGMLAATDSGLTVAKAAPKLNPVPFDRTWVASLLRSAGKHDAGEVGALVDAEVKRLRAVDEEEIERRVARRAGANDAARRKLETLAKAYDEANGNGSRFDSFEFLNDEEFARAVVMVLKSGLVQRYDGLHRIAQHADAVAAQIRAVAKEFGIPEPTRVDGDPLARHVRRRRRG